MAARESTKMPETDAGAPEMPGGALPGQITSPNPVEVFWEKHKVKIWIAVIASVLVYLGGLYWQYQQRLERNDIWSKLTSSTGLDSSYQPENFSGMQFGPGLDAKFGEKLAELSVAEIEEAAQSLTKPSAKALALWFLARRHALDGNVDAAKASLAKLAEVDPSFPALIERTAPPVYIEIPEVDEKDPASKKAAEEPPLPGPAKLSSKLVEIAERQAKFRAEHAELYTPPTPAEKPIVRLETTEGTIVIKFYPDKAPKHVAQFVKNVEDKVYDNLSFHRITRMGEGPFAQFMFEGKLVYFGDPATKEDDRTKWGKFKSETQIEDERSGISHFPFMLAADRDTTKKGSDSQLVYFTASDATKRDDGYVVFGRVVEGQDVVTSISEKPLSSAEETQSGSGVPATTITITKATVEK